MSTKQHEPRRFVGRLHHEEDGAISLLTVFAALLLTMLLGMVMNVGRHVDGKIRMQNAADSAAYSGGVVLARGMNSLVFSNHLLADAFAMTAFMREARQRNAETYVPEILGAWSKVGSIFAGSTIPKFAALGPAIIDKAPKEQQMVTAFGDWGAAASEQILPMLEEILAQEMIPEYQRAVVATYPEIAQRAALEVARRNGEPSFGRGPMLAALWHTDGTLIGSSEALYNPVLPVVDAALVPTMNGTSYRSVARQQRRQLATLYLRQWNSQAMSAFDYCAKMSQFGGLWRSFTCGQLDRLLDEEFPDRNLLFVIRTEADEMGDSTAHLQQHFTFIGVSYWRQLPELLPGMFTNPTGADAVAYAGVRLFVPRRRLVWKHIVSGSSSSSSAMAIGGVPGQFITVGDEDSTSANSSGEGYWRVDFESVPTAWTLLNQRWTCQLVPATADRLTDILQTVPPRGEFTALDEPLQLPNLGSVSSEELQRVSPH